jgi:hypothetical protein
MALVPLATLTACGGGAPQEYPLFAPSASMTDVDKAMARHQASFPPEGLVAPAGIRTYGNTVLVIDVLVALPDAIAPGLPRKAVFESIFSGLGVFDVTEGRGFAIRSNDGGAIALRRFDISKPPDALTRDRLGLMPWLEIRPMRIDADAGTFDVAVLPIVVRTDQTVPIGSPLCVRIDIDRSPLGLRVVRDELCVEAGAMPTAR